MCVIIITTKGNKNKFLLESDIYKDYGFYPLCKCIYDGMEGESDGKYRVTVSASQRTCQTVLTQWEFKSFMHLRIDEWITQEQLEFADGEMIS